MTEQNNLIKARQMAETARELELKLSSDSKNDQESDDNLWCYGRALFDDLDDSKKSELKQEIIFNHNINGGDIKEFLNGFIWSYLEDQFGCELTHKYFNKFEIK
jgi:hypothetical protein